MTRTQFTVSAFILLASMVFISWGVILIKNSKSYKSEDMVETFKEDEGLWSIKYKPQLEALNVSVILDNELYNRLNSEI